MKNLFLLGTMVFALGMMTSCKSGNNSECGGWSFQLPWNKPDATSITPNSILNTKWIIDGKNRPKEMAVYLFIKQDSSVVVADMGKEIEYGYVCGADEDCIRIKINAYNSRATKYEGSRLYIDRKSNHLYAGLDAYKSKDPRKRQDIEQIPMSDYMGEAVEIPDYIIAEPQRRDDE